MNSPNALTNRRYAISVVTKNKAKAKAPAAFMGRYFIERLTLD
jgi:hypothetical protein